MTPFQAFSMGMFFFGSSSYPVLTVTTMFQLVACGIFILSKFPLGLYNLQNLWLTWRDRGTG